MAAKLLIECRSQPILDKSSQHGTPAQQQQHAYALRKKNQLVQLHGRSPQLKVNDAADAQEQEEEEEKTNHQQPQQQQQQRHLHATTISIASTRTASSEGSSPVPSTPPHTSSLQRPQHQEQQRNLTPSPFAMSRDYSSSPVLSSSSASTFSTPSTSPTLSSTSVPTPPRTFSHLTQRLATPILRTLITPLIETSFVPLFSGSTTAVTPATSPSPTNMTPSQTQTILLQVSPNDADGFFTSSTGITPVLSPSHLRRPKNMTRSKLRKKIRLTNSSGGAAASKKSRGGTSNQNRYQHQHSSPTRNTSTKQALSRLATPFARQMKKLVNVADERKEYDPAHYGSMKNLKRASLHSESVYEQQQQYELQQQQQQEQHSEQYGIDPQDQHEGGYAYGEFSPSRSRSRSPSRSSSPLRASSSLSAYDSFSPTRSPSALSSSPTALSFARHRVTGAGIARCSSAASILTAQHLTKTFGPRKKQEDKHQLDLDAFHSGFAEVPTSSTSTSALMSPSSSYHSSSSLNIPHSARGGAPPNQINRATSLGSFHNFNSTVERYTPPPSHSPSNSLEIHPQLLQHHRSSSSSSRGPSPNRLQPPGTLVRAQSLAITIVPPSQTSGNEIPSSSTASASLSFALMGNHRRKSESHHPGSVSSYRKQSFTALGSSTFSPPSSFTSQANSSGPSARRDVLNSIHHRAYSRRHPSLFPDSETKLEQHAFANATPGTTASGTTSKNVPSTALSRVLERTDAMPDKLLVYETNQSRHGFYRQTRTHAIDPQKQAKTLPPGITKQIFEEFKQTG